MTKTGRPAGRPARLFFRFSLTGRRVFTAQQTVRRFVLLDGWKTADRRIEPVVCVVVVALADLPQEDGAGPWLHGKIVVQALRNKNALPRS